MASPWLRPAHFTPKPAPPPSSLWTGMYLHNWAELRPGTEAVAPPQARHRHASPRDSGLPRPSSRGPWARACPSPQGTHLGPGLDLRRCWAAVLTGMSYRPTDWGSQGGASGCVLSRPQHVPGACCWTSQLREGLRPAGSLGKVWPSGPQCGRGPAGSMGKSTGTKWGRGGRGLGCGAEGQWRLTGAGPLETWRTCMPSGPRCRVPVPEAGPTPS